jgi:carbonic anhydrase
MTHGPGISADEALQRLKAGNERFLRGEEHPLIPARETLTELARGQSPFATILGCSDSRVSPERIFDVGLGELFVIRVAGNVLSPEVAGSMQYAGSHLQTPLFVVLGHEGCGAIQAALATKHEGVQHRSRIQLLVDGILPALAGVDPNLPPPVQLARSSSHLKARPDRPKDASRSSAPSTRSRREGSGSWISRIVIVLVLESSG